MQGYVCPECWPADKGNPMTENDNQPTTTAEAGAKLSREAFIAQFFERSNLPESARAKLVALPCACHEPECCGWAMVENESEAIRRHNELYGPSEDSRTYLGHCRGCVDRNGRPYPAGRIGTHSYGTIEHPLPE
jgi:hypothetical protein